MNYYKTISQLEKLIINGNKLAFCEETGLDYYHVPLGSIFNVNGFSILNTGAGGDTRWIAIDTFMNYSQIDENDDVQQLHGMKLQQGIAFLTRVSNKVLQKIIIFDQQFSTIPVIIATKSQTFGLSLAQRRNGTIIIESRSVSSITINYEQSTSNFAVDDIIEICWIAMGEF